MNFVGLIFVATFAIIIFILGLWVAYKKEALRPHSTRDLVLAGRSLGLFVGIFSLVATEVGSAFINGTAEETYNKGFLWCIAPLGYSISMSINGLFFMTYLRDKKYVTVIDPLQSAYGSTLGGLVYAPSCIGNICWTAAVLYALGSTLGIVLEIPPKYGVIASSALTTIYTLFGGMYSVAFTDVFQLIFIIIGLWISIPFMLTNSNVDLSHLKDIQKLAGKVESYQWASYLDGILLIICGGIPWQDYYQRILSVKSNSSARIVSFASTGICITMMIPPIIIGGVAKSLNIENAADALPLAINKYTPPVISYIALGAISAAAMSSIDSSLLSNSSYIVHNIYMKIFRKNAGKLESILIFRLSIVIFGVLSTLLSFSTESVYDLWVLAGDLGYVVVFPQFVAAVLWPDHANAIGSFAGIVVGVTFRLLIGEKLLKIPSIISNKLWMQEDELIFPIKTAIMASSFISLMTVSILYRLIKRKNGQYDVSKIKLEPL